SAMLAALLLISFGRADYWSIGVDGKISRYVEISTWLVPLAAALWWTALPSVARAPAVVLGFLAVGLANLDGWDYAAEYARYIVPRHAAEDCIANFYRSGRKPVICLSVYHNDDHGRWVPLDEYVQLFRFFRIHFTTRLGGGPA